MSSSMDPDSAADDPHSYQHDSPAKLEELEETSPMNVVLRRVPRFLRFDHAPIEATGLSVDMFARATIVMSSLFLGPALLVLANESALEQCSLFPRDSAEFNECSSDARIYGFRPSSLLSNIAVAGGVLGAVLLPPLGAIVDHTSYRKQVGMYSALLMTLIKPAELAIGPNTWFAISWLQVVTGVLFSIHVSSIFAYVSELSCDPDQQAKYNTHYFVVMYFSTLVFMIETLGMALILDTDTVGTARIALGIAAVTCSLGFSITWKHLFRDRAALSSVPDGESVVWRGFKSLYDNSLRIHKELPALRWLMMSIVMGEGANAAVVTIGTTYMVHFLQMTGRDVGTVFLLVLISGPIGSKMGEFFALRFSPVASAKLCLLAYLVTQSLTAVVLTGPERSQYTKIFGVCWGLCLGWLPPMFTTAFITIRPSGMDAQMMSLYLFCGNGFIWLPPLVFSICNEYGVHMSLSILSLNIFFILSFICLLAMGDYDQALEAARASNGASTVEATEGKGHTLVSGCDDDKTELPPLS